MDAPEFFSQIGRDGRRLVREIEMVLRHSFGSLDEIQADIEHHRLRMNPRTGETELGDLCQLCSGRLVAPGIKSTEYLVCNLCWQIDQRVGELLNLPYVIPVVVHHDLDLPVPASVYAEDEPDGIFEQLRRLQEDSEVLTAWHSHQLRKIGHSFGVYHWPDVPVTLWLESMPEDPRYAAACYVEFLYAHVPDLADCWPVLVDPDFLLERVSQEVAD